MKLSTKAILWSAFGLPGAGQIILKRYIAATIFIMVSVASLIVIVVKVFDFAYSLAKQLRENMDDLDTAGTIGMFGKSMVDSQVHIITIAVIVFMATWIISIADAYRAGEELEK